MLKLFILVLLLFVGTINKAEAALPPEDSAFAIEGQLCPTQPNDRARLIQIYYPGGRLANVLPSTGIMVILHNWGGVGAQGSANPVLMANFTNNVVITVDYFQSGNAAYGPAPYDHGLYQATDALRALWTVFFNLKGAGIAFDSARIYCVGGSGGGNVCGMANRLAPRTFASIVDMSGPKTVKFSGPLNSRWVALPPNEFRIRDLQDAALNAITRSLGSAQIRMVHGRLDEVVPYADVVNAATSLGASLLTVEPWGLWGPYLNPYHSIGDRTLIAMHDFQWPLYFVRRTGLTDFERNDNLVRYPVVGGRWGMSFNGPPTLLWLP